MTAYDSLVEHLKETQLVGSINSLLGWDERTKLPKGGGAYRAEQMTYVSGLLHKMRTDPRVGDWLAEAEQQVGEQDPHSDQATVLREARRSFDKLTKLPQDLVENITRAEVEGQQAWVDARAADDFPAFAPYLKRIIELKRQQAEAIGYDDCIYDALMDDFEPGEKTSNVRSVLEGLREDLVPLVEAISESANRPDTSILTRSYPASAQESFGTMAAAAIGFDFERGRLDVTHHPFCTEMGPDDTRITTRYDEHFFPMAFFGILHEAGHGIYDQGLRGDHYGTGPGEYLSLGFHESQSRMWENQVGRSLPFWTHMYSKAQDNFDSLQDVALSDFYFAINNVQPSLIRVEADEVTYNLHIIIRFELEQAFMSGDVSVEDLPGAWSEKYQHYLGITPPNDADGVMQDIHWSAGLIGYFPTYSLGNLYAAQLFDKADEELGGLHQQFERGEFQPLKEWLVEKIHKPGRCYSASELIERVTGNPLSHSHLVDYLYGKLGPLYGIERP